MPSRLKIAKSLHAAVATDASTTGADAVPASSGRRRALGHHRRGPA
ncbi:hypothetical protein [Cupriavidus basilensis]|nr:hypothetical protein [Cupriavidus basilensis]